MEELDGQYRIETMVSRKQESSSVKSQCVISNLLKEKMKTKSPPVEQETIVDRSSHPNPFDSDLESLEDSSGVNIDNNETLSHSYVFFMIPHEWQTQIVHPIILSHLHCT